MKGYSEENAARRSIVADLNRKSMENKPVSRGLSFGFLFFPGEASSARELRLQLLETDTGQVHILKIKL